MSELPLDLARTRDLVGREDHVWARRAVLAIFALISLFALLNGFGQRASNVSALGPAAQLEVHSPERVRGGLLFQARFTIRAQAAISKPQLVLGPGWLDGLTLNTIEPDATEHKNRNGSLALVYDKLAAGDILRVFLEYQVNPTTVGRQSQRVEVYDGSKRLAGIERDLTVLP